MKKNGRWITTICSNNICDMKEIIIYQRKYYRNNEFTNKIHIQTRHYLR